MPEGSIPMANLKKEGRRVRSRPGGRRCIQVAVALLSANVPSLVLGVAQSLHPW
jgi:hypothetical protein